MTVVFTVIGTISFFFFFFLCGSPVGTDRRWNVRTSLVYHLSVAGMERFTRSPIGNRFRMIYLMMIIVHRSNFILFFFWLDSSLWSVELDYFNFCRTKKKQKHTFFLWRNISQIKKNGRNHNPALEQNEHEKINNQKPLSVVW